MRKDLILVLLLVTILGLMVIPINQALVDVLLAINISLSIALLMVAIYIKRPSNFSTFPSVILLGTAFRLALSIATTRLILSEADAGTIVETFGDFVVSGSVGIGLVIFLIITVVQFLVITKGAERVAEVGARFALDAMPGKQMTIDAEVRAENITAEEGKAQRITLDRDSQFFGAMDGAMKFVKGDAVAGLIIICINLIGGIIVGLSVHNMGFGESATVFSLLTIGDGLVAQFPALLMSMCAGIMVTRVTKSDSQDLGSEIIRELVSDVRVPAVGAVIVFGVGLIPGFPTLIFTAIAAGMVLSAGSLRRRLRTEEAEQDAADETDEAVDTNQDKSYEVLPLSDRLIVSLGTALSETLDNADVTDRLGELHWTLYEARGVMFPRAAVKLLDENIGPNEVVIYLDEVPLHKSDFPIGMKFVRQSDCEIIEAKLDDIEMVDLEGKVYPGKWVGLEHTGVLDEIGISHISQEELLASLVFRLYEHNLGQLFSNTVLQTLLEAFRAADGELMQQIEEDMKPAALLKTFRYLVEDGVPLRPAELVVASLHYWINNTEEPTSTMMAEGLRNSMRRQLCHSIAGSAGVMGLSLVDPSLEKQIRQGLTEMSQTPSDPAFDGLYFEPDMHDAILERFRALDQSTDTGGYQFTIVTSPDLRRRLRNYLAMNDIHLPVLSPNEIAYGMPSFSLDVIKLDTTQERTVFAGSKG